MRSAGEHGVGALLGGLRADRRRAGTEEARTNVHDAVTPVSDDVWQEALIRIQELDERPDRGHRLINITALHCRHSIREILSLAPIEMTRELIGRRRLLHRPNYEAVSAVMFCDVESLVGLIYQ